MKNLYLSSEQKEFIYCSYQLGGKQPLTYGQGAMKGGPPLLIERAEQEK